MLGWSRCVTSRLVGVLERIDGICRQGLDERDLRVAVLAELRTALSFDAYAWLLTDPVTCVGSSPVAEVPNLADLPSVIHAKYLTTVNRWTGMSSDVAVTLAGSTGGDRSRSLLWSSVLSRYGICDVASVVLRDSAGCWGFVDLWRRSSNFEPHECDVLSAMTERVTPALRQALLGTFEIPNTGPLNGPIVLLLTDDLGLVGQTERTEQYLRALLPAGGGRAAVPAAAYNVAAQLLAVEAAIDDHMPQARVHVPGRSWTTIRAGRITTGPADGATIAVSIEPTSPAERAELYGRVAGLTPREADVLAVVVTGDDTRHAAQQLAISDHTLQDHLKSIFAKTRTNSRRLLIARATGASR